MKFYNHDSPIITDVSHLKFEYQIKQKYRKLPLQQSAKGHNRDTGLITDTERNLYYESRINAPLKILPQIKIIKVRYKKSYLKGLQLTLKGRLKGARRARKMTNHHGSIGPNTYNKRSKSNQQTIYTKWGT